MPISTDGDICEEVVAQYTDIKRRLSAPTFGLLQFDPLGKAAGA